MARHLKQSTAFTFRIGPFLDSTDGVTAETALSIAQADIQISKNGGAFAQTSASPTTTHDADGWYQCPLTTTDTNTLGPLTVQVVMSGALPVWEHFMVLPANVYDSLYGSDKLEVDVAQWIGTAPNSLVSNRVDVSVGALAADVITAAGIADDAIAAEHLATDAIGSDALAASAATEIRDAVNGGAYALDTDSNGRIRIVDGTGAGELDTSSGTVTVGTNNDKTDYTLSASALDSVEERADNAIVSVNLDHLMSTAVLGADVADNSALAKLVSASATADWDDYVNTTDSLQALRDRGDSAWTTGGGGSSPVLLQNTTIATLASQTSFTLTAGSADDDAYNDFLIVVTDSATSTQKAIGEISDYTGSTKTVTLVSDPGVFTLAVGDTVDVIAIPVMRGTDGANTTTPPTAVAIRTEIDSNSTQLAAIVADTNELQGDWANGGRLDLILDTRMAEASINTTGGAIDTVTTLTGHTAQTGDSFARLGAPAGASVSADNAAIKAETALVVADTNELQTDWADGGRLDLILDARASQTTANAIETDTQDIQGRLPTALVGGKMDSDATAISGSTDAADMLEAAAETLTTGAATSTTLSTTQMSTNLTEATDDHYNGKLLTWTSGALLDQQTDVTDYNGTTKTLTFTAVTEAPSDGDTFVIS